VCLLSLSGLRPRNGYPETIHLDESSFRFIENLLIHRNTMILNYLYGCGKMRFQ